MSNGICPADIDKKIRVLIGGVKDQLQHLFLGCDYQWNRIVR